MASEARFCVGAVVTVWTESEIVWVFLLGGLVALFVKAPPRLGFRPSALMLAPWLDWLASGHQGPVPAADLWRIVWYFTEAGAFVFGSGLAIRAIAGAAFVLGRRTIVPHPPQVDVPALVIAVTALAVLLRVKKVPEPLVILAAGMVGLILKQYGVS